MKVLYFGFDLESDLLPYNKKSELKGDKFSEITNKIEKAKKDLTDEDLTPDAIAIIGGWIDKFGTDEEWKNFVKEQIEYNLDDDTHIILTLKK